jgi:hydrogenase maturation factor HypF (carbamoyltransferase family)
MAGIDDTINKAETALNGLYGLQQAAMKKGDVATQKALESDVDELLHKLTQLRSQQINANQTQIDALNVQLDKVTAAAQGSMDSLDKVSAVLNAVDAAAKLIDKILSVAA